MNAIPVLAGRFFSSSEKASSPPAEAPMPTTGKFSGRESLAWRSRACGPRAPRVGEVRAWGTRVSEFRAEDVPGPRNFIFKTELLMGAAWADISDRLTAGAPWARHRDRTRNLAALKRTVHAIESASANVSPPPEGGQ